MRGIPSLITDIRKKVFTEVARMAYEGGDYSKAEDLPYVIVPGDRPLHRESVFLERAIAGERVRLAMGLSIRPIQTRSLMTEGMDAAAVAEQYYEPPLINIIPYACHACPTNQYKVSNYCQNCIAASCQKVCPKDAISATTVPISIWISASAAANVQRLALIMPLSIWNAPALQPAVWMLSDLMNMAVQPSIRISAWPAASAL